MKNIIYMLLVLVVNSQESCGKVDNPTNSKDCTMMSTLQRSCCYKFKDGENASCIDHSIPTYKNWTEDGYNIICPSINDPVADVSLYCGEKDPSPNDCSRYSNDIATCCYMQHKGKSYCINLGLPYDGNHTVGGDVIVCSSSYIYISYLLLSIFLY